MKLFISYGHRETEICRRICDVLRARGHKIWFDETHIPHGLEWRAEIVKEILSSEGVLSMIDRHSVRVPGVCLDEMSIAIGVCGGNIRYVLVEKQAVAEPPVSMTTRQWLDMSDWRNHENDQAWFDTKMEELIRMVESRENLECCGIIEELRKKLPACHVSTSKQDSLLRQPFIGRAWVKDKVCQWLDNPDGTKICVAYGDPGIGKSAFAAHYTHYSGRIAAAFFCDYTNTQFNHSNAVIQTLAFLLACRLPDYRIALVDALTYTSDLGFYNESELFDVLLAQPLSAGTVDADRETMCILIDGLDESEDRDKNVLTEVLTKYADRLPKWLRILAFSRREESIIGLSGEADLIELIGGLEENKADVRAYFEYCLSGPFDGDENYFAMIDRLSEKSGGIFLYATLMADALAKGKISIEDTESVPDGLDSAIYQWFRWFFPDIREYEKNWQIPLACIAASPEPIPEEEIKTVFNWTNTKLDKLKHTLEVLLRKDMNDFKKDTLQLSHRYISEWIFSDAAGCYQVDRGDAFREMGAEFLKIYKFSPKELTAYEAYYLRNYVNVLSRKEIKELLLEGLLHGIVVEYGDYAKTRSRYDTAMKYYTLSEGLAFVESENRIGLDRLNRYGRSLRSEGETYERLRQYREAMELYNKSLILFEKIADQRGTLEDLRSLSVSYAKVAGIYEKQGRYFKALDLYRKELAFSEKIFRERGTLEDLWSLYFSYNKIAGIYEMQSRYSEAIELYRKSLELGKKISIERGLLDVLMVLSVNYYKVGRIYEKQNQYDEALNLYRKSLELKKKIVTERGTLDDLKGLSASCYKIAEIHEKQGRFKEALLLCRKDLELSKRIVKDRGTLDDLWSLAASYEKIAEIYEKQSLFKKALEFYLEDQYLVEKIASEWGVLNNLKGLSASYNNVDGIYEKQSRNTTALALHMKILELRTRISGEWGQEDEGQSYFHVANSQDLRDEDDTNSFPSGRKKGDLYGSAYVHEAASNTSQRMELESAGRDTSAFVEEFKANERIESTRIRYDSYSPRLDWEEIVESAESTLPSGVIYGPGIEKTGGKSTGIKISMKEQAPDYGICRVCGAIVDSTDVFCRNCGNRLHELKLSNPMPGQEENDSLGKPYGYADVEEGNYNASNIVGAPYFPPPASSDEKNSAFLNNNAPLKISKVHFSAIAPRTLTKGEYAIIDIVMYQDVFRSVIDEIIKKEETPPQETRSGTVMVREGVKVKIQLTSPDIVIEDNVEEQEWVGDYLIYNFAVMLPKEYAKRQVLFMATVYIDDVIATRLKFVVKCWSLLQQKIKVKQEDVLSAFVSYASQDRNRVALIVQGMQKARPDMDIFFDVESLRSGESWEEALWTEINQRDTLFLCWSRNAAESPWVAREWKYCYKQKGAEAIEPIPLEPPSLCPPPEELKTKHFNDRLLYLIKAESERNIP